MRKIVLITALILLALCLLPSCGNDSYIYVLASEDNQNDVMSYTCTYENSFDKKTRTLTFTQIGENGNPMGYGVATYDENGNRLTYTLKDGNRNTYLSQEFTYDEQGRETGAYTRMLGNPDCMEYKTWEEGVLVGGMLCYYDENGNITSTEIYKVQTVDDKSVISYYDTEGALISSSGYKETYDKHGNLLTYVSYTDGSFTEEASRVSYTYKRISIS